MMPVSLLPFLLLRVALAAPPAHLPPSARSIQGAEPHISCLPPWCAADLYVDAPPDVVRDILMDFSRYPEVFPRVRSASVLEAGRQVHVTLAMPFPLADRDYVVQMQGDPLHFTVEPVSYPEVDGVVRLVDFAARWDLDAEGQGTRVHYLWHTDLGADIPAWAVERAWITQGNEILLRLRAAAESR